jgi:nitrogen regulatory protein P-II 1
VKKIEAYIRHDTFDAIRDALDHAGLPSMSVVEVKGSGRQKGYTERYRGARMTVYLRPKLKLEIAVADEDLDTALDIILAHAQTGEIGDGKILVSDLAEAIRVRTGERGENVLARESGDQTPSLRIR